MKDGNFRSKIAVSSVAIALFASGCDDPSPMLQFQKDVARDRDWILTSAGVTVLDLGSRRKVAQIPLPDWQWAGAPYGCTPALAIGPGGEALISSDVLPVLWRIDPKTMAVTRHELLLEGDSGMDVGISGLAYSTQQEKYIAVGCAQGSVWRVDPALQRGQKVSSMSAGKIS